MAIVLRSLRFLLFLCVPIIPFAFAQDENQFIYNGFSQSKLRLDGLAEIHPNGLLQLTDTSSTKMGHTFDQFPVRFKTSSSLTSSTSFSTNFVFAMVPGEQGLGGQGIAFTISPSADLTHAFPSHFMGLFNSLNIGLNTSHILAIELDTIVDPKFDTINENHVGIDVNNMKSIEAAPPMYFSEKEGKNIRFNLTSWNPMHMWINYDEAENLLNVTLAPTTISKPNRPLLSKSVNLSEILLEYMYVGFSSSTGTLASDHYILGWSFNTSGPAESLDVSSLPRLPRESKRKEKTVVFVGAVGMVMDHEDRTKHELEERGHRALKGLLDSLPQPVSTQGPEGTKELKDKSMTHAAHAPRAQHGYFNIYDLEGQHGFHTSKHSAFSSYHPGETSSHAIPRVKAPPPNHPRNKEKRHTDYNEVFKKKFTKVGRSHGKYVANYTGL